MIKEKEDRDFEPDPTCKNLSLNNKNFSIRGITTPKKIEDPYLTPDPLNFIMRYIAKKVKHEETLIKLTILVMASAYTPNPLNLALESPQSEGKSYSLVEVSKIFPTNDVWDLGGMTPQVLTRERGYHVDRETGKNIEKDIGELKGAISVLGNSEDDKLKRTDLRANLTKLMNNAVKIVDMQGKILLFLEAPHHETFARLRPILSRDKYEIEYKFVDRAYQNGPQVTMEARIRGWPVAIYATADNPNGNLWDQIRSRFIIVSPNMKKIKYKAANEYTASKYGSISNPKDLAKEDKEFQRCRQYIHLLKSELYSKYNDLFNEDYYKPENVSFTWNPMARKLEKSFPSSIGQHMRDFKYFMALMDVSCLFSLFHRPYFEVDRYPHWMVTKWDLKNITEVFDNYHFFIKIGELPIKIFEDIISKMSLEHETEDDEDGFTWKDLRDGLGRAGLPNSKTHVQNNIIDPLEQVYLLSKGKSKADKRVNVYVPFTENYEQLVTNSFLKIKYGCDELRKDFEEIKTIHNGITPLTMNSKSTLRSHSEFICTDHFEKRIVFFGEKSLKTGDKPLNNLNNNFVNKSSFFSIKEDTIEDNQNDLSDEDLECIASNQKDPKASDALNEIGLRKIKQKNKKIKLSNLERDLINFLKCGLAYRNLDELSRKFINQYTDYDEGSIKNKIGELSAKGILTPKQNCDSLTYFIVNKNDVKVVEETP